MRASLLLLPLIALTTALPAAAAMTIPPSAAAMSPTPTDARGFAANVASSDMFEIASSQMLLARNFDGADLKNFARMIVIDHTESSKKLKAILAAMTPPLQTSTHMADKQQKMLKDIHGQGTDYLRSYLDHQVNAHADAIALFANYASRGDDETLKAFARDTLPTLQNHLAQATALRRAMN